MPTKPTETTKPKTPVKPPQSESDFLLTVVKAAIDFNSSVMQILTVELSGDPSSKNRTHLNKQMTQVASMGDSYSRTLNQLYADRDAELKAYVEAEEKK